VIARETVPQMAEELKNVNILDNAAKYDISERFLDNDSQNLQKLGELFDEIEKETKQLEYGMTREETLINLFYIYKGLIYLNDQRLLEMLLSNRMYLQTFGALEWDPEALQSIHIDHNYQTEDESEHHYQEVREKPEHAANEDAAPKASEDRQYS
jgi:hypothetical protein